MSRTSRSIIAGVAGLAVVISVYAFLMGGSGSEPLAAGDRLLAGAMTVIGLLVLLAVGVIEFGIGSSR